MLSGIKHLDDNLYESLLDEIYRAPLVSDGWPKVLRKLVELTGSRNATFQTLTFRNGTVGIDKTLVAHDYPELIDDYLRIFAEFGDVRGEFLLASGTPDKIFQDHDIIDSTAKKKHGYYQEFIFPHDMDHVAMFIVNRLQSIPDPAGHGIGIQRSARQGPFDDVSLKLLHRISPHIHRAAQLQTSFFQLPEAIIGVREFINLYPHPVFQLDERFHVIAMNKQADELALSVANIETKLGDLIQNMKTSLEKISGCGSLLLSETITINETRYQPHLYKYGPKPRSYDSPLLLMLTPRTIQLSEHSLRTRFGLTNAEAKLAFAIATKHTVSSFADKNARSLNTVRSQLKSTMSKMGVSNQVELVRKIAFLS